MSYESPYGPTGSSWFWRAWPDLAAYDFDGRRLDSADFRRRAEAVDFVRRNGGGGVRRMRLRSGGTESRSDTVEIPGQLAL